MKEVTQPRERRMRGRVSDPPTCLYRRQWPNQLGLSYALGEERYSLVTGVGKVHLESGRPCAEGQPTTI